MQFGITLSLLYGYFCLRNALQLFNQWKLTFKDQLFITISQ